MMTIRRSSLLAAPRCCSSSGCDAGSATNSRRTRCVRDPLPGLRSIWSRPTSSTRTSSTRWGIRGPTPPWWVADNGTDISTLYNGAGAKQGLVGRPSPAARPEPCSTAAPASSYEGRARPARFLFATEAARSRGWNPTVPPPARRGHRRRRPVRRATPSTRASRSPTRQRPPLRHRLPQRPGRRVRRLVQPVSVGRRLHRPATCRGATRRSASRTIGGTIYVTYAKQDADAEDEIAGRGLGLVDVYDTDGNFLSRVATGGALNAPWGVALAPDGFGKFGGDLLVGNFGDGHINAYRVDGPGACGSGTLRTAERPSRSPSTGSGASGSATAPMRDRRHPVLRRGSRRRGTAPSGPSPLRKRGRSIPGGVSTSRLRPFHVRRSGRGADALLGVLHGARLADDGDLDLARVGRRLLDLPDDVARQARRGQIVDLLGPDRIRTRSRPGPRTSARRRRSSRRWPAGPRAA